MKHIFSILLVGLVICGRPLGAATATPASASAENAAPALPVQRLQNALIAVMKQGKQLGYRGRYDKLEPVVAESFDFPFIGRLVLGPDWDKLSSAQRKGLVDALLKLSVSSYAHEFDSYSGERFKRLAVREDAGSALVRYLFEPASGDPVHFDYQVHKADDGRWKIANVIVDGVSDLALKRGQYRKLFAEQGYDGLIAWIHKQVAQNGGKKT